MATVRGRVDLGHTGQVGQGWAEGQRGLEEGCAAPGRFQLRLLLTKTVPPTPPTPFFPTRVRATLPMSLPRKRFHQCTFYTLWVNTHRSFLLRLILLQVRCIIKIFLLSLAHKVVPFWHAGQRRDETAGVFAASITRVRTSLTESCSGPKHHP